MTSPYSPSPLVTAPYSAVQDTSDVETLSPMSQHRAEASDSPRSGNHTPIYMTHAATPSTSTFNNITVPTPTASPVAGQRPSLTSKKSRSSRVSERERERDRDREGVRRAPSVASNMVQRTQTSQQRMPLHKFRATPRFPNDKDVAPAAATLMYWSRAPVYGTLPMRTMRAHTVTLIDSVAWLFGGCDDKESAKDIYLFDTDTMQWTHPEMSGEIPPPLRAHTATLVDRKLVIFGGGQGAHYFDDVYVLDTTMRRWTKPNPARPDMPKPAPRRAHTAVYYRGKTWIFGGGNGMTALNDVWTLEITPANEYIWEPVKISGPKPSCRGYHTANLIGSIMVVVGGSDGKECFSDMWYLNLETLEWRTNKLAEPHRRLSHSATRVGSYLFIFGGHDGTEYLNDMLCLNLVGLQYESRQIIGKPPSPRGYHGAILADSRIFVFGGYNGGGAYDDVYVLDLAAGAYLPQVTSFVVGPTE
ncbi:hypothetical protein FB107DRAFT_264064 [Schizophyllum commune]